MDVNLWTLKRIKINHRKIEGGGGRGGFLAAVVLGLCRWAVAPPRYLASFAYLLEYRSVRNLKKTEQKIKEDFKERERNIEKEMYKCVCCGPASSIYRGHSDPGVKLQPDWKSTFSVNELWVKKFKHLRVTNYCNFQDTMTLEWDFFEVVWYLKIFKIL